MSSFAACRDPMEGENPKDHKGRNPGGVASYTGVVMASTGGLHDENDWR